MEIHALVEIFVSWSMLKQSGQLFFFMVSYDPLLDEMAICTIFEVWINMYGKDKK